MQPRDGSNFKHLALYSNEQIVGIENRYHKTRQELENALNDYSNRYKFELINLILANSSNIFYAIYGFMTVTDGAETFVNVFAENARIPNTVASVVGGTTVSLDTLYYMSLISPISMAQAHTWDYVFRDPWQVRFQHWLEEARRSPAKALFNGSKEALSVTILAVTNLTGVMSELIFLLPYIQSVPAKWLVTIPILYYGNKYYQLYSNSDFRYGVEHILRKGSPATISKNYLSTSIELYFQYISNVLLRLPTFIYLAAESKNTLGIWFDPNLVIACVTLHSLMIYRHPAIKFHLEAREKITDYLKNNDVEFQQTLKHYMEYEGNDKQEDYLLHALSHLRMEQHRQVLIEREGYFFVFKRNKTNALYFATRAFIGAYLFYSLSSTLSSLLQLPWYLFPPLGAMIALTSLYFSEQMRLSNLDLLHSLNLEPLEGHYSNLVVFMALVLSVFGAFVSNFSTLGALSASAGDTVKAGVALLCLEGMVNTINYSMPKAKSSVNDLAKSVGQCFAGLFHHSTMPSLRNDDPHMRRSLSMTSITAV